MGLGTSFSAKVPIMFTVIVRRLMAIAVLALFATSSRAADTPLQEILSWVPHDAAAFGHVDVATVWKSKPLLALRKLNPEKIFDKLQDFANIASIPPEMVQTFTIFLPKAKGNGDEQAFIAAFTFNKPYEPKKVVSAIRLMSMFDEKKIKEVQPGIYDFNPGKPDTLRLIMDNPNRLVILGPKAFDLAKPQTVVNGPISDAISLAASGQHAVFGLNFANFPDELRMENGQSQLEPFKPLLFADAIVGKLDVGDELVLNILARCPTKVKCVEAEKSMGVVRTLLQTLLSAALTEINKSKDETLQKLIALAKETQIVLRSAKIQSNEKEASATLTVRSDLDIAPLVAQLTGPPGSGGAANARTQNNMKQIAIAMHNYHDTYGALPSAAVLGKKGKPLLSWRVQVLPYVEQAALFQQIKLDEPWDSVHNKKVFDDNPMPKVFEVPGTTKPGEKNTHMQVFRGNGAMFDLVKGVKFAEVADGLSNTIMVATAKTAVPWMKPDDMEFDPKTDPRDLMLYIGGQTNISFGDGSVRILKKSVTVENMRGLITKSGGEVVNID